MKSLQRLLSIFTRNQPKRENYRNSGEYGEELATRYLTKKGYTILQRNYRCRFGEIDIIAKKKDVLVFIEVKYSDTIENPYLRVGKRKIQRLVKTSRYFLMDYDDYESIRFDVISIYRNKIDHFENLFE